MLKGKPERDCRQEGQVLCPCCERFTVKQRARINQAVVTCAFLLLLGATGALVWVSVTSHDSAVQVALSRRADAKQASMDDALFTWARLADQVGRIMAVLPNTTTEAYRFFVSGSSPELDVPALISVSWAVPVVNDPEAIAAYEEYARRVTMCPTATINYHTASNFSWRPPANEQPEFLPFTQTTFGSSAAMACNAAFVGFDLLAVDPSNAVRRTSTLEAIAAGQALASTPVNTSGTAIEHLGIVQSVLAPVFVDGVFKGLVSAAFQATDLVAAGALADDEAVVHAVLTDVETGMVLSSDAETCDHKWVEYRNLTFGGRTWELLVVGDDEFAEAVPNEAIWTSLLACILTGAVGALVLARVRDEAMLARATKRLLLQMSHDLRTPLHSIWHAAQEIAALPGVKDNPAATEPTVTLKWCATLAKNILDNILDMSHISKGTLDVVNRPADVLASLATAVTIMRATAEDGGTRLKFEGEQTGPVCMVDSEKLIRVVLNIIGNAIKFTPGGLVQVKVTLDPYRPESVPSVSSAESRDDNDTPKYVLRVAVQDNGRGMDEATLVTATRAYAHASSTLGGGSGIGLHVAKTIVEQYDGALELDSPGRDRGSTVSFSMVLSGSDGTAPAHSAWTAGGDDDSVRISVDSDANVGGDSGTQLQRAIEPLPCDVQPSMSSTVEPVVLVVDDSRLNRRVAMHALRDLKHVTIEQCVDGLEALRRLKALAQDLPRRPVLCLMDQSMPNMGGDEATRQYREWATEAGLPREEQAWICVLTGDVVTTRRHSHDPGFDHRLTKPCPADTMKRVLSEQLGAIFAATPLVATADAPAGDGQTLGDVEHAQPAVASAASAGAGEGAEMTGKAANAAAPTTAKSAVCCEANNDGSGHCANGDDHHGEDEKDSFAVDMHTAIFCDDQPGVRPPAEQNDSGSSNQEVELPSWIPQGGR